MRKRSEGGKERDEASSECCQTTKSFIGERRQKRHGGLADFKRRMEALSMMCTPMAAMMTIFSSAEVDEPTLCTWRSERFTSLKIRNLGISKADTLP